MNENKIFTTVASEPFFPALVDYIFTKYDLLEITNLKIIVPYRADIPPLLDSFKKRKKAVILPNIASFENIDEEYLILNVDKVKVISQIKRILLLTEFIVNWNKDHTENFQASVAYSLASLLDELQHNQIPLSALYKLNPDDSAEHWHKTSKFLSRFAQTWLQNEETSDICEHRSNYITNLEHYIKDKHVIFVGIHPSKICHTLIKAIYNLDFGLIVLPNLDLSMKEEEWHKMSENHHQYCLKRLLDYIGANRKDVKYLSSAPKISDQLIEYTFDLSKNLYDFDAKENSNFEIITCQSQEEEAQIISMIIKNEDFKNVSLFISDKLLFKRVNSLLGEADNYYLYVTFLLYILDVLTSNWGSVELLSLLKHPFTNLGYSKDEYSRILANFEIKILRSLSQLGIHEIKKSIDSYEISSFFSKVELSFAPLVSSINSSIFKIAKAHVECALRLSKIDFLQLSSDIGDFMTTLIKEYEEIKISSLESYQKILSLLLQSKFTSAPNHLHRFSLHKNKIVILTNFNEGYFPPDFQNPLLSSSMRRQVGLPSIEEKQSYFQYILHNLLHAEKVYITRSTKGPNGINSKPMLLQRLEMLIGKSGGTLNKQPFKEWLKLLTKPDFIIPCSRPKPKPSVDIRLKKLQILSSTGVEKLIRNPYSFYIEYILDLRPLRELNFRPTIMHFGIAIHKIFEKYLLSKNISYEMLLNIAYKYMNFSNVSSMWWPKFQKITKNFFKLDTKRRENFNIVEVEKSFSWPLSEKITIKAKCDRVEHLLDGGIAIVDYKTGSLPTQSDIEMFFSPQLILQAITAMSLTNKEVKELMYWKFDGAQVKIFAIENHQEIIKLFSNDIKDFLSNFLNENVPFAASYGFKRSSKDSHYKHLERTEEWL